MRFRKKPVAVEAVQWKPGMRQADLPNWADGKVLLQEDGSLLVHTLEGAMSCRLESWLIRGVQGEVYPCKPDIFDATHEPDPAGGGSFAAAPIGDRQKALMLECLNAPMFDRNHVVVASDSPDAGEWVRLMDMGLAEIIASDGQGVPVTYHLTWAGREQLARILVLDPPRAIDMVLQCPRCRMQHIDAPQPAEGWNNPPHRSHECQFCGFTWRPADVPTNGVDRIKTRGRNDGFHRTPRGSK